MVRLVEQNLAAGCAAGRRRETGRAAAFAGRRYGPRQSAAIAASNYDLQGRRLPQLAAEAREQLLAEALQFTRSYRDVAMPAQASAVFLAGHQPEMFHPGVWYKNFVLARLAEQHHAVAVNLVIDSDAVKSVALRVPGGSIQDRAWNRLHSIDRRGGAV